MMTTIDNILNRITMYRFITYLLVALVTYATVLSYLHLLPFTPVALLISTGFLVIVCEAANNILAKIFAVPANVESSIITALILALIIDPIKSVDDLQFLGWAAILAMSSKYIVSINNKHIFNPAALAVVITSFALNQSASWWVGTGNMLLPVAIGGFLMVRKVRQTPMVVAFLATALVGITVASILQQTSVIQGLQQLVVVSPLVFFATVMLTEPLTAPPTTGLKVIYGAMIGVLILPQVHFGGLYSTPELALVVGNVFAFIVSPKQRVVLTLRRRIKATKAMVDFVFAPSQRLAFAPGQYMEWTLAHQRPDARGNRRYFTIASSPTEENVHLGVRFYDRSSSYKQAMYNMDARTPLHGAQIAGDFTLPRNRKRKLVFIAGGIGITPFRSMLKYLIDTQQRRDIILFYANKTANDIMYTDVLNEANRQLGILTYYTLTDVPSIAPIWRGYRGRITEQMIRASVPDYLERSFYLSGPPDMITAYEQVLLSLGVQPRNIKKDFFPGLV